MSSKSKKPAAEYVSERGNIILKAFIHEFSLALDLPLIPTAHAVGTDRQAIRLAREIETRALRRKDMSPNE
ncbi:hypothetical protein ACEUAB_03375 [Aeromonas veronii]